MFRPVDTLTPSSFEKDLVLDLDQDLGRDPVGDLGQVLALACLKLVWTGAVDLELALLFERAVDLELSLLSQLSLKLTFGLS